MIVAREVGLVLEDVMIEPTTIDVNEIIFVTGDIRLVFGFNTNGGYWGWKCRLQKLSIVWVGAIWMPGEEKWLRNQPGKLLPETIDSLGRRNLDARRRKAVKEINRVNFYTKLSIVWVGAIWMTGEEKWLKKSTG
jgi:hypothetical protein